MHGYKDKKTALLIVLIFTPDFQSIFSRVASFFEHFDRQRIKDEERETCFLEVLIGFARTQNKPQKSKT